MSGLDKLDHPQEREWPLYEVFVRGKRGLNHVHVGSLHAPDDEMAIRHARDVYTRRNEGVSIWVVRADAITASSPDERTRCSRRAATRSTGTRRSTPSPTTSPTCDSSPADSWPPPLRSSDQQSAGDPGRQRHDVPVST